MSSPKLPLPAHPLRWFPEFWELGHKRIRGQARLFGLSLLVGIIAGLGAIVFYTMSHAIFHYALGGLAGYSPEGPGGEPPMPFLVDLQQSFRPWMLLLIPTIGGLISGIIVYTWAPEAEGHGTDAAIDAYHHKSGRIRPLVPLVKIVASALTLGSGGSGGREGPIAQIGAGFGSVLGGWLNLSATERRILMAAGMGAGISAIFRAPLAGALFAAEVLYRSPDFESEVIIPAALASISAYCMFCLFFGWGTLFALPQSIISDLRFKNPLHLVSYLVLALFVVVLAMLYTRSFYWITHRFHKLRIRPHFKPALGALFSAALGLVLYYVVRGDQRVLAVLGFGYGALGESMTIFSDNPAMASNLSFALVLLLISLGKIATTGLTIGSGGSGGVFGPSMVIGGCGGGALGIFLHWVRPHWLPPEQLPHPTTFIIVGMAGFFAAAAKTPLSTLVMVSELTGDYLLLLPTLWVCSISFLLSDEQSIYSSQVESRSRSPAHQGDYVREVLTGLRVRRFLTPIQRVPFLSPADHVNEVIERLNTSPFQTVPVLDAEGQLLGMVTLEEVIFASQSQDLRSIALAVDLMRANVTPLTPEHRLDEAMEEFVEQNLPALPVVEKTGSRQVVGVVRRTDVSSTYLRHVHGLPQREENDEDLEPA
jgi:CIC family chloride channel protein